MTYMLACILQSFVEGFILHDSEHPMYSLRSLLKYIMYLIKYLANNYIFYVYVE